MEFIHDRRTFLRAVAAAGTAWAAADVLQIEDALAWASQQTQAGTAATFRVLSRPQADVLDAISSRILPAVDGRPGAHDAGVVFFIDRALATFYAGQKKMYVRGVADVNRRAAARWPGSASFAALTPPQQDALTRLPAGVSSAA